jgi:GDP-mannose 6-dehydrogenase
MKSNQSISVFGLGYVGLVTAACFSFLKNKVIGIDINPEKIKIINSGKSHIVEPRLEDLIQRAIEDDFFYASDAVEESILKTDISIICLPTPSDETGHCNIETVLAVCKDIAHILSKHKKNSPHVIVFRSTVPPGTMEFTIIPTLEKHSSLKEGVDFFVCFHPEFLREGFAVDDFFNPPKYVFGENSDSFFASNTLLNCILKNTEKKIYKTDLKTAEIIKYADNIWHALKVSFANEIGTLAKHFEIDGAKVMDVFCHDHKLNISSKYLKPGPAYGGSCLPKDLKSIETIADEKKIMIPLIHAIAESNRIHIQRIKNLILQEKIEPIGFFGITFKSNTDDLRHSPALQIAHELIAEGISVLIYDPNISAKTISEANHIILKDKIPTYKKIIFNNYIEFIEKINTLVVAIKMEHEYLEIYKNLSIIDLVNTEEIKHFENYHGICW